MYLTKIDKLIIILIIIAAFASLPVAFSSSSEQGSTLTVLRSGKEIASYNLAKNTTEKIAGNDGGYCILQIKDGKAFIQKSTCPNKICMKQGQILEAGQTIVCAPMGLLFEVKSQLPSNVDAIND